MNTTELKKLAEAASDNTIDRRIWDVLGDYYEAANPAVILELLQINAELVEALKLCAAVCAGETLNKSSLIRALEKAEGGEL